MSTLYTASTQYTGSGTATFAGTSPVTGSAPTDPLDGIPTASLRAFSVYLSVGNAITLSGAGSLAAYVFSQLLGRWTRFPGGDISVATSGVRDLCFGPFLVDRFKSAQNAGTRIAFVPTGVTFSSGSGGATVTIEGENVRNSDVGA